MKLHHVLTVLAGVSALVLPLSAQVFVGSDDFGSSTVSDAKWAYAFRFSGTNGLLDYSAGRLDFSKAAGAGSYVLGWDGEPSTPGANPSKTSASFTTSWVADVTVTNSIGTLTGGEFLSFGLEVAGTGAQYSSIMLVASSGGYNFRAEGSGFTPVSAATADFTDVHLRLAWDAGTQVLNSSYSFDGGSYTPLATYNPVAQWTAGAATGGFYFEIFGNSNMAAAISTGSVYADNFSVSAIPEPSTYAAFAGLGALGLAFWRRRQARALATA
ncbi:MAG: PEP-CTERM sorting domain-containing protein [Lacunisphaera sp.]|nr:PEP-CTERM sorting domain-containing protein [Lacunisphaera sp.]